MNEPMKRPWWGIFCIASPDAILGLYLVPGLIILFMGTMIGVATHMTPTICKTIALIGAIILIIGFSLAIQGNKTRFIIRIRRPFVLISKKDGKIILKQPLTYSSYWFWDPRFQPNNVVIEYGETWIDASGKTAITLRDADDEQALITISTTIRVNPSLDQAIEFYRTHENKDLAEALKEWLEQQISQFNTTAKHEDYSEIKAKCEQLDNHYDISVTDFIWSRQFEGLITYELLDYFKSRLDEDWSKCPLDLSISSINEISLCYD